MTKSYSTRFVLFALLICASATALAQDRNVDTAQFKELPNFGRVGARLYRGAQPRERGLRKLASLGVNTIINLRDDDEHALREASEAKSEGLRYFNIPFKRLGRPDDSQVDQVLSIIAAKENGVVFVHCHQGEDRTGMVIALYRISHDDWTDKEAIQEAKHFGMKFWQRGMKSYISDYFQNRSHAINRQRPK